MARIIVECKPDKLLVMKLGFPRKDVDEAGDKSRVYFQLKRGTDLIALVDEDPSPDPERPKYPYERTITFVKDRFGLKLYNDTARNNSVIIFGGKLEDWLLRTCKSNSVDVKKYGLPDNANDLHKIINQREAAYKSLIDHLLEMEIEAIMTLKNWLGRTF